MSAAAPPEDFQVRAYMIANTANYLAERLGEPDVSKVLERFSQKTQRALNASKRADWCHVSVYTEVLNAVAELAHGDEDRAREELINAGSHVAREATNSFLRLLMKMLNPTLFAKKLPDFWRRDCTKGRLEVDVTEHKLVCRMFDMEGFDHVPCTCTGFVRFALESMGKSVENTTLYDWSLKQPYVQGATFELVWKS